MKRTSEEKKERPVPNRCICGKQPADVRMRGKVMLSCPAPIKCPANLRTRWHKGVDSAIVEWNCMISEYRYNAEGGNYGNQRNR